MARTSEMLFGIGQALVFAAVMSLIAWGTYVALDPADEIAIQRPCAAVLKADACLGGSSRSKSTLILQFDYDGASVVGKLPNYYFLKPDTVQPSLLALRAGDSVLLNTRGPIEGRDEVDRRCRLEGRGFHRCA
jgi:hypothetical protein